MDAEQVIKNVIDAFDRYDQLRSSYYLLKYIPIEIIEAGDDFVACISPDRLIINKKTIESMTFKQLCYVLYHETLHIILVHHKRIGDRNRVLWNIATDLMINEGISNKVFCASDQAFNQLFDQPPDQRINIENFVEQAFRSKQQQEAFKCQFKAERFNAESVYNLLCDVRQNIKNDFQIIYDFADAHEQRTECEQVGTKQSVSDGDSGIKQSANKQQCDQRHSDYDQQDSCERGQFEVDQQSDNDMPAWVNEIRRITKASGQKYDQLSYQRPSRRNFVVQTVSKTLGAVPAPSIKLCNPVIHLHLDTSGSISRQLLRDEINQIYDAIKVLRFEVFEVFFFTQYFIDPNIKAKANGRIDLTDVKFPSGGTSLEQTLSQYTSRKLRHPDIMIIMTDGEFNCSNLNKVVADHVFWVVTGNKRSFPNLGRLSNHVFNV